MKWTKKHLLDIEALSAEEIAHVLDRAAELQKAVAEPGKKLPLLAGRTVCNLFFEASTRTTNSFALAARKLSADVMNFSGSSSSTAKGETLLDTARNIQAMGVEIFVCRHAAAGAPHLLARELAGARVVNAGDGCHEHPTQALLDLYTIREAKGRIAGLTVAILGDITHSRVARSNLWGLTKLGARVVLCGPPTLIPPGIERLGVEVETDLDRVLPRADVLNCLRIQFERQDRRGVPSVREYHGNWGVTAARLARAKKDVLVMHPGPINRGIELTPEVADGERSVILRQVANGVAVRMAVLALVAAA